MVVVMTPEATDEDVQRVVDKVTAVGGEAFVSKGLTRTIIGLVGDIDSFHGLNLRTLPGVGDVQRISDPFKLVSRQHHPERSTVAPPGHPLAVHSCMQSLASTTRSALPVALTPIVTTPGSGASALTATSHCTGSPGRRDPAASQSATDTRRRTRPCTTCVVGAAHAG